MPNEAATRVTPLIAELGREDCRALGGIVAQAFKTREVPEWPEAINQLSECGKRRVLSAAPVDVLETALNCWARMAKSAAERGTRRVLVSGLRAKFGAEAEKRIEAAQIAAKQEQAQEVAA
jgi:hypothetical protein